MNIPGLENLKDIPEKTQQMQDSLDRIEKLLRVLIEVSRRGDQGVAPITLQRIMSEHGLDT